MGQKKKGNHHGDNKIEMCTHKLSSSKRHKKILVSQYEVKTKQWLKSGRNFLISDQAGVLFFGGAGVLIKGTMWEIATAWCYFLSEMSYEVFVFLIWTKHIAQS